MSHQFQVAAVAYAMLRSAVPGDGIASLDTCFVPWNLIAARLTDAWTELEVQEFIEKNSADLARAVAPAWRLELSAGGIDLTPRAAPVK